MNKSSFPHRSHKIIETYHCQNQASFHKIINQKYFTCFAIILALNLLLM